eukprot:14990786-Ditylum_brightwellii.AAC.1
MGSKGDTNLDVSSEKIRCEGCSVQTRLRIRSVVTKKLIVVGSNVYSSCGTTLLLDTSAVLFKSFLMELWLSALVAE